MNDFYDLFARYLREKNSENVQLDWSKIQSPTDDQARARWALLDQRRAVAALTPLPPRPL